MRGLKVQRRFAEQDGLGYAIEAEEVAPLYVTFSAYQITSVDDNGRITGIVPLAAGRIGHDESASISAQTRNQMEADSISEVLRHCYAVAREILGDKAIIGWLPGNAGEPL